MKDIIFNIKDAKVAVLMLDGSLCLVVKADDIHYYAFDKDNVSKLVKVLNGNDIYDAFDKYLIKDVSVSDLLKVFESNSIEFVKK